MPSLHIDWCLEIWGHHIAEAADQKCAFIAEFDCELSVEWNPDYYGDGYTYRIDGVTVEWGKHRHIITPKSDPALWIIIRRGIDADKEKLTEKIHEGIAEALSDEIYSAPKIDEAMAEYR